MRNLKKFLALVLAMVMAFSLMLSASAATSLSGFQDADKVTPEFVESVTILAGLDVIKGDGDEDNKTIRPQDEITRAEAAALVYRVVTGDVNDRQVQLYSDYGKFADVNSSDWFAGYVGYCQNAGIIKGTTPTTFSPYLKVTGYEVLAMILRAVGYGKNNEFTGSSWQVNVASLGKTKHITDSISSAQYNYTLNMNARREIVAELLFRGAMIPQVTWTAIGGYNEYDSMLGSVGTQNDSLAQEVFGLRRDGWRYGSWGRPELVWTASLNPTSNPRREVAVLPAAASHSFTDLRRECDVAEMLEITTSDTFVLFVDAAKRTSSNPITIADDAVTDAYKIVATDTVTKVGGYGRLTEIYLQEDMEKQYPYYDYWTYWSTDEGSIYQLTALADTFVMIDTYLAKVVSTAKPVLDTAGHVITPARMTVELYDNNVNVVDRRTIQKPDGSKDEWEYSDGDVLSLKGVSDETATDSSSKDEKWAFTLPSVGAGLTTNNVRVLKQNTHVFDITKLNGTQGKQTTVYWNNGKHQVDGEDKTDALALRMDKAGSNIDTTYTWYYDVKDNGESYLLGIDDGSKVNYGVITSIYVSYGANEATDGVAKAVATVKYADGTTGTETIDYFLAQSRNKNAEGGSIAAITGQHVNDVMTEDNLGVSGTTVQLWPYYNVGSEFPMHEYAATQPYSSASNPSPKRVSGNAGTVFMAPVAASNAQSANAAASGASSNLNDYGILNNNLWKFVKSAGDKTVAIEVAGGNNTDAATVGGAGDDGLPEVAGETGFTSVDDATVARFDEKSGNNGVYEGHWADVNVTVASGDNVGKVNKALSYITIGVDVDGPAANGGTATTVTWLDDDTQIMVRNAQTGVITCYNGVSNLPGNVTISTSTTGNARYNEVDWADTDNDGRADVVYLTGTIDGVTTYGLFYTNDLTASWDGSKAVMHGFWNGEETDVTFTDYDEFTQVKNVAVASPEGYKGHLFALQQIAGVVTDVMFSADATGGGHDYALLHDAGVADGNVSGITAKLDFSATTTGYQADGSTANGDYVEGIRLSSANWSTDTGSVYFRVGSANGNPYSAATEAVYYSDSTTVGDRVVYNASSNWTLLGATVTTEVDTQIYRLTPNSKVYGIGSNVVLAEGVTALEYLNHSSTNDVTIIHENNSVIEMYIQTDPNITPSNPGYVANTPVGDAVSSLTGIYTNDNGGVNLSNAIKAAGNNTVIYCADKAADFANMQVPDDDAPEQLYFPFQLPLAQASGNGAKAYLSIYNASGSLVFAENTPNDIKDTNGHYFMINFRDVTKNSNASLKSVLTAGSYTFTIVAGGVTISSGSFTIV